MICRFKDHCSPSHTPPNPLRHHTLTQTPPRYLLKQVFQHQIAQLPVNPQPHPPHFPLMADICPPAQAPHVQQLYPGQHMAPN
jgi:hypothetical protein